MVDINFTIVDSSLSLSLWGLDLMVEDEVKAAE